MSRRSDRVAHTIRAEVGRIILRLSDPRIGFVTITHVEVSPDFTVAKVKVSVLDTEARQRNTLRALQSARKRIQMELSDSLQMRRTPELVFILDPGVKHSIRMSQLLHDIARERGDIQESPEPAPAAEGEAEDPDETEEEADDHDR